MKKFLLFAWLVLALVVVATEWTDGFHRVAFRADRDYVTPQDAVLATPRATSGGPVSEVYLRKDNSPPEAPVQVSEWVAVNAFPETDLFRGAMHMRPHPKKPSTWFISTYSGLVLQATREQGSGDLRVTTVVDLTSENLGCLLSFALQPNERDEPTSIFLFYRSIDDARRKFYRVVRCPVKSDGIALPTDQQILIEQEVEHYEHLGGALDFDENGFLLIAVGDNGLHDDLSEHSQRIDRSLFSGILRIDVNRTGGETSFPSRRLPANGQTGGYYVPNDNPFVDHPGALPEFWSIGFRNPFRMHFDTVAGAAWVGEVGQDRFEQLEKASHATNHQWSYREGRERFHRSYLHGRPPTPFLGIDTAPHYEYFHQDQDYCIVAGPVYRHQRYPQLNGKVLFGDNQSGRVWAIDTDAGRSPQLLLRLPSGKRHASLTSICVDHEGRIFTTSFASRGGVASIHELVPQAPAKMPIRLSETAYFKTLSPLIPSGEFVPYTVNSPLWSDGMEKDRWFTIPEGTLIDNSGDEQTHWKFPKGSVFIKHFRAPDDNNKRTRSDNIETRILIQGTTDSVYGATYRWDDDGQDAILVLKRDRIESMPVPRSAEGASDTFSYRLPSPNDCLVCHNRDNLNLGFTTAQFNRPSEEASQENQIVAIGRKGWLKKTYSLDELASLNRLVPLDDTEASLEHRARSYLHSNCSLCHHRDGTQRTHFLANIDIPLNDAAMVDADAQTWYMPIDQRVTKKVIRGGEPDLSLLYRRMTTHQDEHAMPYLGRNTVDRNAAETIAQWIRSLSEP
ncbi:PQQ-dependent sugar dehydrogenase [Roseiconus lacunae]|uniref:PQQ-dependent sugar dehydrogenase n=1 Tax=Roseiconus lacunae TaxID=2605694 RepID=A0ABT7PE42_9BACT|nr:PQQ-dependent sugar dehydrogenase [Roseiconus lacunae]MDM4014770.1 PQQ-dependent sugar dehydrogenase [Roseiconus lacunae]